MDRKETEKSISGEEQPSGSMEVSLDGIIANFLSNVQFGIIKNKALRLIPWNWLKSLH